MFLFMCAMNVLFGLICVCSEKSSSSCWWLMGEKKVIYHVNTHTFVRAPCHRRRRCCCWWPLVDVHARIVQLCWFMMSSSCLDCVLYETTNVATVVSSGVWIRLLAMRRHFIHKCNTEARSMRSILSCVYYYDYFYGVCSIYLIPSSADINDSLPMRLRCRWTAQLNSSSDRRLKNIQDKVFGHQNNQTINTSVGHLMFRFWFDFSPEIDCGIS